MRKLFFTLVFMLVITSCGTKPTSTIMVTMDDFLYDPIKFTVSPGDEIAFNATNTGTIVHDFVIMKLGKSAGPIFGGEDAANIYWQVEIAPGASMETSFIAPTEPGEYEVVCSKPGHLQAGMKGQLFVVADE